MRLPAISLLIAVPLSAMAFRTGDPRLCVALLVIPQLAATLFLAPGIAMVQHLAAPRMRAVGSAVFMLFLQGVGASLGPFLAGMISDMLQPAYRAQSMGTVLTILSSGYA